MTELEQLRAENLKLRKILAHVPARIGLKAKEDAGFGERIVLHNTQTVEGRGMKGYMVVDDRPLLLCEYVDLTDGVLLPGKTATVFYTKKDARAAITRTKQYATKNLLSWRDRSYEIVPVERQRKQSRREADA